MSFYTIVFMLIFVFILIIAFFIMNKNKKDLETDGEFSRNFGREGARYYDNEVFEMEIDRVHDIGEVRSISGIVRSGFIKEDDKIIILGKDKISKEVQIEKLLISKRKSNMGRKGDYIGLILKYSGIIELKKGDKITKN